MNFLTSFTDADFYRAAVPALRITQVLDSQVEPVFGEPSALGAKLRARILRIDPKTGRPTLTDDALRLYYWLLLLPTGARAQGRLCAFVLCALMASHELIWSSAQCLIPKRP